MVNFLEMTCRAKWCTAACGCLVSGLKKHYSGFGSQTNIISTCTHKGSHHNNSPTVTDNTEGKGDRGKSGELNPYCLKYVVSNVKYTVSSQNDFIYITKFHKTQICIYTPPQKNHLMGKKMEVTSGRARDEGSLSWDRQTSNRWHVYKVHQQHKITVWTKRGTKLYIQNIWKKAPTVSSNQTW